MADVAKKAQKLAAARKKLKEFQQKGARAPKNDEHPASSVTTTNSSRHSSISNGVDFGSDGASLETEIQQSSPLHNYFNGNEQSHLYTIEHGEEGTSFFDSLALSTNSFDIHQHVPNVIDDVKSLDYSEVESRNVYGYYANEQNPTVSSDDATRLPEFLGNNDVDNFSAHNQTHIIPQILPEVTTNPTLQPHEVFDKPVLTTPSDLDHAHYNVQSKLKEQELKILQLEKKLEENQAEYERKISTELTSLQDNLNGHIKTIEMYIAENNSLSDSLYQTQTIFKQKVSDCEELQGRLKVSRSRVIDLEQELQAVKNEKTKLDEEHVFEVELKQLKQQCEELKQLKDETHQDALELREKLNIKANENIALQRELQDVTHQLSLAHIKIDQISIGENSESQSHIEALTRQKAELEKQVVDLTNNIKTINDEKTQTNLQYQHYVQQLNAQVATLANKLEILTSENESLSKREQSLIKHIGELEKHLQTIQEEKANYGANKSNFAEVKRELDIAQELAESLKKEKQEVQEKYEHICSDQDDMLTELATKKDIIEQLEDELERLKVDQPNNVKLLATIESDKVAASRAVAQNATLKQELEEMQQAFVRMSNDKLELTEQLSTEQYKTNDLQEQLNQLESKLHTLWDAIEIKDNELTHIRETLSHQNKQLLQNNQLTDRLRHYEAQDSSTNALQLDLQNAQDQINILLAENLQLKDQIAAAIQAKTLKVDENIETRHPEMNPTEVCEIKANEADSIELPIEDMVENTLDKEIAMKHLEEKFTRTMADIANLVEEKQRLEHIVLQLQGETDTIGEYIALYQHQRGILQQRTLEKEEQLRRLTNDRMDVKIKLEIVNDLVNKLAKQKAISPEILAQHDTLSKELDNKDHSEHSNCSHNVPLNNNENNNVNSNTADQILQLLSEIKESNLVQPCDALGDFHSCSCCSGQLFTV